MYSIVFEKSLLIKSEFPKKIWGKETCKSRNRICTFNCLSLLASILTYFNCVVFISLPQGSDNYMPYSYCTIILKNFFQEYLGFNNKYNHTILRSNLKDISELSLLEVLTCG